MSSLFFRQTFYGRKSISFYLFLQDTSSELKEKQLKEIYINHSIYINDSNFPCNSFFFPIRSISFVTNVVLSSMKYVRKISISIGPHEIQLLLHKKLFDKLQ